MDFYKDSYGWKVGNGYAPAGQFALRVDSNNKKIYVDGLKQLNNGSDVTALSKNIAGDFYVDISEFVSATYEFFNAVVAGTSGEINTINGKIAGTFFGDDFTTTQRIPMLAAKWSQGLPLYAIEKTFNTTGKWYIPNDPQAPTYPDSVSIMESGTDAAGKVFLTSLQPNRYEPGHISYFGYTIAFKNIDSANGDFTALVGAFIRGSFTTGQHDLIKDGICWGFVRASGVTKKVLRVYKNFQVAHENEILLGNGINHENLLIIEHQLGFYGIHPSIIWYFDPAGRRTQLLDFSTFEQDTCHIHDPNLAMGVYLENQGNTVNLQMFNGSMEYGNYAEKRDINDSSGRNVADRISIASLAVDTDPTDGGGLVAAYRVTDNFTSFDSIDAVGTTTRIFQSKIENVLINLLAAGSANRTVRLNIYMLPEADIVATFTPILPNISVLEKALAANITSVDFANAKYLYSTIVTENEVNPHILIQLKPRLRPGYVAVFACEGVAETTVTDLVVNLNTIDLF